MSGGGGVGDAGAAGGPATGGAAGGVGDGGAMGGASTDAGARDAGPTHPIECGNGTCLAPAQFCCIPNVGATRCLPTGSTLCPNAGDQVHCDDHTDCGGVGEICCARDVNGEGFSDCRLLENCTGQMNAQLLCNPMDPTTCPPTSPCRADVLSTIDTYPYCH